MGHPQNQGEADSSSFASRRLFGMATTAAGKMPALQNRIMWRAECAYVREIDGIHLSRADGVDSK